ncbi:hypothetical protein ACLD0F_13700 [Acinetobacter baumannii]
MADGQTKNSALTTALAFHYQVLIGLEKCFSLEENQAIWFEKDEPYRVCRRVNILRDYPDDKIKIYP